jgi:valyl-tRNA synthetase
MDLRPQGQEIIRTWLFYTVVRAELERGVLPWSHAAISGWVVDPDRAKLSKSKGNAVSPTELMDRYGADAFRHWAAGGRLGSDTTFDEGRIRVGRRLAIKVLNVSRFILGQVEGATGEEAPTDPLDRAMLAALDQVIGEVTDALDAYDHTGALERAEAFFWRFCDDHVELVKDRAYGSRGEPARASAAAGLRSALDVLLRLLAPYLPFATEEVWSWWRDGSVHRAAWPTAAALRALAGPDDPRLTELASWVLVGVRRAKTAAKVSMRAPVQRLVVRVDEADAAMLRHAAVDLTLASAATHLAIERQVDDPGVEVTLA